MPKLIDKKGSKPSSSYRVYWFTIWIVVIILLFFILLPILSFWKLTPAQFSDGVALFATIGGIMGAIFTIGGLVVALAAILTVLTIEERVNKVFDNRLPELHAHIHSYEAEDAIRDRNWEQADSKTMQAIQEYSRLPNMRRKLGLQMSYSIGQSFIKEHRREGTFSISDEPLSSIFIFYSPASVERAKIYGINKRCAAMLEALKKAIAADPEWKEQLREPNSLILLAHGCIDEPNIQDTLERLRRDLGLPMPEETFTRYIKEQYGKVGLHGYWAIGRPDYWIEHHNNKPNFPIDILVYPKKEGEKRQAHASFSVPGNRDEITKEENSYFPIYDLFNELEKRFFLICPTE